MTKHRHLLLLLTIILYTNVSAQQVDLAETLNLKKIEAINRTITIFDEKDGAIEMDAVKSDGLGILQDIEFEEGTIEVFLLGENKPGQSFIGIAFNIQDGSTYEAVYFRPFNFVAEEQARRDHMVQYIFHPEFTWRKLREERTMEFENEIANEPEPDDWFKATIMVTAKSVEVYVNDSPKPDLVVDRLTSTQSKRIGIWTGYNSSGRFADLVLK
jgi:hypothetical protein